MRDFGVANAYGDLRRVLMHRPGSELDRVTEHTLAEFHFERPVDRKRFVSEYDAMVDLLAAHGVEPVMLDDVLADDEDALGYMSHRPNMTYTRDLAAMFDSGAVLMSPHLKGRWGDQRMLARAFDRLGIPILGWIEPPGFLEGGGVTMIGRDTAVASLCDRANETGTRMLRELVLGRDVKYFLEVPLPFGHIHIDGVFMTVDEGLALVYPESFRVFPCRLYEAGRSEPRHVLFDEFLHERGVHSIPITRVERDEGHLNVVVTKRSKRAIGFESASRLASELGSFGIGLDRFSADELFRGNGGAHCMTCPIHVE